MKEGRGNLSQVKLADPGGEISPLAKWRGRLARQVIPAVTPSAVCMSGGSGEGLGEGWGLGSEHKKKEKRKKKQMHPSQTSFLSNSRLFFPPFYLLLPRLQTFQAPRGLRNQRSCFSSACLNIINTLFFSITRIDAAFIENPKLNKQPLMHSERGRSKLAEQIRAVSPPF